MVYDKSGVAEKGTVLPGNNCGGVLGLGNISPDRAAQARVSLQVLPRWSAGTGFCLTVVGVLSFTTLLCRGVGSMWVRGRGSRLQCQCIEGVCRSLPIRRGIWLYAYVCKVCDPAMAKT